MTVLILLAAAAGTRIVAPDLFAVLILLRLCLGRRRLIAVRDARVHEMVLELRALACEQLLGALLCRRIHDGRGQGRCPLRRRRTAVHRALLCGPHRRDDAHMVHERGDLIHDRRLHLLEHRERLDLVLDKRVALAVGAQVDALAQHVHVIEVIHPLLIDDAEHDDLFELAHILFAEHQLAVLVALLGNLLQFLLDLVAREHLELRLLEASLRGVDLLRILDEGVELPFLGVKFLVRVLRHLVLDDVPYHREDVVA